MVNHHLDIIFIVPTYKPTMAQECIGPLILAQTVIKAGYSSRLLRYWELSSKHEYNDFADEAITKIMLLRPKIVSFYCRESEYHIQIDLARRIKENDSSIVTVLGGPQSELTSEATLSAFHFIDYVCCGEGENTIVPLVLNVLNNNESGIQSIQGLTYRDREGHICQNGFPDMLPDNYVSHINYYDLIPSKVINNSNMVSIDVGRGCPFACDFCSTKTFWKRRFRLRNIDDTLDEITYVNRKFHVNAFNFEHDLFTANKIRIKKFCKGIIERNINITWECSSRIDTIDYDMIDNMVESGLRGLYFGIETGSQRMQKIINKNINIAKCLEIVSYSLQKGVYVTTSFIYGFPEETEEDLNQTLALIVKLRNIGVKNIQLHLLAFENGTALYEKYKQALILDDTVSDSTNVFGRKELNRIIVMHPEIFPSFYNYPSQLRKTCRYLELFVSIILNNPKTFIALTSILNSYNINYVDTYKLFVNICTETIQKLSLPSYNNYITYPIYVLLFEKFLEGVMNIKIDRKILLSKEERLEILSTKKLECNW